MLLLLIFNGPQLGLSPDLQDKIFSRCYRNMIADDRSDPYFTDSSRDFAMASNTGQVHSGEIGLRTAPPFDTLTFQNGFKDRILMNTLSVVTSGKKYTFCSVTTEFTRLDCLQQTSISIRVSFTTFARCGRAGHLASSKCIALSFFSAVR